MKIKSKTIVSTYDNTYNQYVVLKDTTEKPIPKRYVITYEGKEIRVRITYPSNQQRFLNKTMSNRSANYHVQRLNKLFVCDKFGKKEV